MWCITWYGVGTLCKVDGNINAVKYRDILDNHLWTVLARHFADKPDRFQDDNVHRDGKNEKLTLIFCEVTLRPYNCQNPAWNRGI
jgi:hypothetical protein